MVDLAATAVGRSRIAGAGDGHFAAAWFARFDGPAEVGVVAVLPAFILLYAGYTFFLEHYALVVVPSITLLIVLSITPIVDIWPTQRNRILTAIVMATLAFCVTGTSELNHGISDEPFKSTLLRGLHELSQPNSIILFTYDRNTVPLAKISEEPVYNTDVAWPDDAPFIRAHDLGPRNIELFRYYAARQPNRSVELFDRATGNVRELGLVRDFAALTASCRNAVATDNHVMGFFSCCGTAFKTLSRAAAKSAAAKLRFTGVLATRVGWTKRAEVCERSAMCVVRRGVSYCGRPFLEQVDREVTEGCGCPTVAKAKNPGEHCPLTIRHAPANPSVCDCKWCSIAPTATQRAHFI